MDTNNHHYDNHSSPPLSATSFREALQQMRALREQPPPVYGDNLALNPRLQFDMTRIALEEPGIAQGIRRSQQENNGEVILPPYVYHKLLNQGLLVWVDDEEGNNHGRD